VPAEPAGGAADAGATLRDARHHASTLRDAWEAEAGWIAWARSPGTDHFFRRRGPCFLLVRAVKP
jgi:hypothetical protein